MRTIEHTTTFKKDFKREQKGQHRKTLEHLLSDVLTLLVEDKPLPIARRDHSLGGNWEGYRDCHVKPDLVLIYSEDRACTSSAGQTGLTRRAVRVEESSQVVPRQCRSEGRLFSSPHWARSSNLPITCSFLHLN